MLALAALMAGFCIVLLGFYIQSRPYLLKPAKRALHPPSTYRLYACDKEGKLIQTQAGPFYLTNEK